MSNGSVPWRRTVAAAMPALTPLVMKTAFDRLPQRYGKVPGYRRAMATYWLLCTALPLTIAGPRGLADLLTRPGRAMPAPRWLAAAGLVVPPAGALATELGPELRHANRRTVATAIIVGVTNAMAEELLWRGLPVAMFPDDPIRGWISPAVGFTLWHLAPLSVLPHRRGRFPILAGAAMIGTGAGWVAWSTRSLRSVLIPHAITDSCGIRAARTIWMRSGYER